LVDEIVLPEATRVLARSWFGCDQSDGTEVPVDGKLGPHAAATIAMARNTPAVAVLENRLIMVRSP
jgi:hypothetical protein